MDGSDVARRIASPSVRLADLGSDELAHFGIKGMKWGVRRSRKQIDADKYPPSGDHQSVTALKGTIKAGGTRALSNKELKEIVDRMQLEQQLAELKTKKNKRSSVNKGHERVKNLLSFGETAQKAYNLYKSPLGEAIREAIVSR